MTVVTTTLNPCIDKTFRVDRLVPDRKLAAHDLREYPGGGGINVARVVTRLGGQAHALWSCGGDTGKRLTSLLDAEHVAHAPIAIEHGVRENLIVADDATGQQYRFGMPGPTLSQVEGERWAAALRALGASVQYAVVSGSLPGSMPVDRFEALLRAVPSHVKLIVDTKREALRRALDVGVFLIKPNVNELAELFGRELTHDEEVEAAARELVAHGSTQAVVVSLGRAGALLATASRVERYAAPSVRIRSKVGAGDSMVGGIVTALARGCDLHAALRLGVAAGTAAVMNEGTELCHRKDVERLYPSVRRQEPVRT